jgi:hypothetical protein
LPRGESSNELGERRVVQERGLEPRHTDILRASVVRTAFARTVKTSRAVIGLQPCRSTRCGTARNAVRAYIVFTCKSIPQ